MLPQNENGTYNVKYSDGDFEENVARESMRRLTRRRTRSMWLSNSLPTSLSFPTRPTARFVRERGE